jgi:hypothetical protein
MTGVHTAHRTPTDDGIPHIRLFGKSKLAMRAQAEDPRRAFLRPPGSRQVLPTPLIAKSKQLIKFRRHGPR